MYEELGSVYQDSLESSANKNGKCHIHWAVFKRSIVWKTSEVIILLYSTLIRPQRENFSFWHHILR